MRNEVEDEDDQVECRRRDCPFAKTIGTLEKIVIIGNGRPALTVQLAELKTQIQTGHDTTRNLILIAIGAIPVLLELLRAGLRAFGVKNN